MRGTPRFSYVAGRFGVALGAALALAAAAGACGSSIKVPDQGIIVTGCQAPSACFSATCGCVRATAPLNVSMNAAGCVEDPDCTSQPCVCKMGSACRELAQACVGRGVVCPGANAHCVPAGGSCNSPGDPPMLVPAAGTPALEPHCQFVDDVCCTNAPADAGVSD